MTLPWKKDGEAWTARSAPPPHLGMNARVNPIPAGWSWEIRAMQSGELAGHYNDGQRLKDCAGVCATAEEAMRECETNMDEAMC